MIEYLRINDLGVIAGATVELRPGLVALTGETGAGKTMVMTALDLLFGGKANPALIRVGAERAEVEAGIRILETSEALAALEAELDDGTLIVGRSVGAQRSRAWLAGRGVPASTLAELGDDLVVRHGQNDQRRLASAVFRRRLLDRFAGGSAQQLLGEHQAGYDEVRALQDELARIRQADRDAAQRSDLLRHGLVEIEAAAPQPGEDESLANEARRLANIEEVRSAVATAYDALRGAEEFTAEQALSAAAHAVAQAQRHDEALAEAAGSLAEAEALIADAASTLAAYLSDLDADPQRLDAVQQRIADLRTLKRKYGDTLDEVLGWAQRAAAELDALDNSVERIDALQQRLAKAQQRLAVTAEALHQARAAAAERLGAAVTAELGALALPHASVRIVVTRAADPEGLPLPDGTRVALRRDGCDEVDLLFVGHAGAPPRPIGEGASGGELSRVMLALEVSLAEANPVPVFVFDEVDAGIGGRAAVEVGRRLAALGRTAQVIVVTHLPQVAAFADQHIVVCKQPDGQVTASSVVTLDPAEQQRELARMLAGLDDSASAMAHAAELIDLAERDRTAALKG